ncbi:MAG: right-handed parallel beta-helix repeat-containing protein, partial [Tepidisphaeraceae bacterium]
MSRGRRKFDRSSCLAESLESRRLLATFVVTNTTDSDPGSLRVAINNANNAGGSDAISFSLGAGSKTINLLSALPDITGPVLLDATTQPGFSGTPMIELKPTGASGANGIHLVSGANGTTIKGLIINRFGGFGISDESSGGNLIQGNYIGTDAAGNADRGNGQGGIFVAGNGTVIGGEIAAQRNIVSGNDGPGIQLDGNNNTVLGNFIGLKSDGAGSLGNDEAGVFVDGSGNAIGGTRAGQTNFIAFNDGAGIQLHDNDANVHNPIRRNSIFSNGGLGIDIFPAGSNDNDSGDGDSGANNRLNYPVISSVVTDNSTSTAKGSLSAEPNQT